MALCVFFVCIFITSNLRRKGSNSLCILRAATANNNHDRYSVVLLENDSRGQSRNHSDLDLECVLAFTFH